MAIGIVCLLEVTGELDRSELKWNGMHEIKDLKWMNWHEGIEKKNWNEGIAMNK